MLQKMKKRKLIGWFMVICGAITLFSILVYFYYRMDNYKNLQESNPVLSEYLKLKFSLKIITSNLESDGVSYSDEFVDAFKQEKDRLYEKMSSIESNDNINQGLGEINSYPIELVYYFLGIFFSSIIFCWGYILILIPSLK